MTFPGVEFDDIQGLVRFAYKHHTEACFCVLQIADGAAARAWFARQEFASAVKGTPPDLALQVAFTYAGLTELDVPSTVLDGFPTDFRVGMTGDPARSRRLGDVGINDPKYWRWGAPGKTPPHVLVMLFAKPPPKGIGLENFKAKIQDELWRRAFKGLVCLSTSDMGGTEPFGFADGISQPEIDWPRDTARSVRNTFKYTNISALGEFLLGYPNEYARYTDRPLLDRKDDPKGILPDAEDAPSKRDFGRNGTYLVLRDLAQNVAKFREYADDPAKKVPGTNYTLSVAMVGRTREGCPIVERDARRIDGVDPTCKEGAKNQFTFRNDPDGTECPLGAHIRRANPRNADLPEGTKGELLFLWRMLGFGGKGAHYDLLESVRFHRILRRAREYGPLSADVAASERSAPGEVGLRFVCLNANILRQFEFVQNSWIANPKFEGLDESDPLLGNRENLYSGQPTDTFTRQQKSGVPRRFDNLPTFVTVRGGAYFFMPGLRALRYICKE
jgi:Dyp-type peroxidase family